MANTFAHLAVAREILRRRPELVKNTDSYYMGTVAPDAIESKEGAVRDDKKLVHLRLGITDMEWLEPDKMAIFDARLEDFVHEHISSETEPQQRDFFIGYAVHLITDKVNHGSVRLRLLHELMPDGFRDGTWDFIYKVLNELEAMDRYLMESRPEILDIFHHICRAPVRHWLPGFIEKEYIEKSQRWWLHEYVPRIKEREVHICALSEIDDFVLLAADRVLEALDSFSL